VILYLDITFKVMIYISNPLLHLPALSINHLINQNL